MYNIKNGQRGSKGLYELPVKKNFYIYIHMYIQKSLLDPWMKCIRHFSSLQHHSRREAGDMYQPTQLKYFYFFFFHNSCLHSVFIGEKLAKMLYFVLSLMLKVCSGIHYCLNSILILSAFQQQMILRETVSIFSF